MSSSIGIDVSICIDKAWTAIGNYIYIEREIDTYIYIYIYILDIYA